MSKPFYSLYNLSKRKSKSNDVDPIEQLRSMISNDTTDKDKNHIYFYSDVDPSTCLDLNRKINDLNKELLKHSIEYDCEPPHIYLHINSNGGCLLSAMGTVDTIQNSRVPIVSIVEGCAASAATVISMSCHKRYITTNSFMLIHQLSTGVYGKYEEIKDDFMNDTKFMERLYSLYRKYTKMPDEKIKAIMTRDIWWDSNECVEYGLVDTIWNTNITNLSINRIDTTFGKKDERDKKDEKVDPPSKKRKKVNV